MVSLERATFCPDWSGSVGWVSSCKLKGHWFNSCSGHVPGSWASLRLEGGERGKPVDVSLTHRYFSSPLPSFPSKNTYIIHTYIHTYIHIIFIKKERNGPILHVGLERRAGLLNSTLCVMQRLSYSWATERKLTAF